MPKNVPGRFDFSPKQGPVMPKNYRKDFEHERWLKKKRRQLKKWSKRHKGLRI